MISLAYIFHLMYIFCFVFKKWCIYSRCCVKSTQDAYDAKLREPFVWIRHCLGCYTATHQSLSSHRNSLMILDEYDPLPIQKSPTAPWYSESVYTSIRIMTAQMTYWNDHTMTTSCCHAISVELEPIRYFDVFSLVGTLTLLVGIRSWLRDAYVLGNWFKYLFKCDLASFRCYIII